MKKKIGRFENQPLSFKIGENFIASIQYLADFNRNGKKFNN